jgi:hypothetical protein
MIDWLRNHAESVVAAVLLAVVVPLRIQVADEVASLRADCERRHRQLDCFVRRAEVAGALQPGDAWRDLDGLFPGHLVQVTTTAGLPHLRLVPEQP